MNASMGSSGEKYWLRVDQGERGPEGPASPRTEGAKRRPVRGLAGGVVPTLNGSEADTDHGAVDRVTPIPCRQRLQSPAQFTAGWRRGQQGANDRKAPSCPAIGIVLSRHASSPSRHGCGSLRRPFPALRSPLLRIHGHPQRT